MLGQIITFVVENYKVYGGTTLMVKIIIFIVSISFMEFAFTGIMQRHLFVQSKVVYLTFQHKGLFYLCTFHAVLTVTRCVNTCC